MVLLSRPSILLMVSLLASPLAAAELPPGFTEQLMVDGLEKLTAMAFAPDGRLFIAQQTGALLILKDGALLPTPFLEVSVSGAGEQGISTPVDLVVSDDGSLYYLSRLPGAVHRISFTGAQAASSPAMSSGTGATISSGAPVAGWTNASR